MPARLPHDVTRAHIIQAMDAIDRGQILVPPRRKPTKYVVKRGERTYPPKFLICKAHEFLDGTDWPNIFGGGPEANNFLIGLRFDVWDKSKNPPRKVGLFAEAEDDESAFPEGRRLYRFHRQLERDSKIAKLAKDARLAQVGEMLCDVCGFSFARKYGPVGVGFIEAHHTIPVSELRGRRKTKIEEIALVCSNCHRILHRRRPWLSVTELREMLDSTSG